MAFDAITGKAFVPQFKGQRTGVDIDFDPAEWQEAWQTGTQGDVEARALADIRAAMGQGGTATDQQVQNVFGQLFGGYNPDIDYKAAGAVPNVFMRSGAGLDDWRAVDAAGLTGTQPTIRGVDYNVVPQINAATVAAPTATTMGAPAATTAAPASTRRTTSVTQPDAAAAAAAEVDPAIAQREIIERALAAKLKPIQNALAAGLLDVQAAQTAWDAARSEIYGDFLTEQTGVQQGFQTQQEADEAKRLAGRTKLLQDLNAAGVDSGMVADELALIDAIAEGSGQERTGLIGDMGRIGLMSDADRRMMGEGIFGGYEQDLRSQARQATLGAELDAAGQIQTAEERALSAGRLSDYMGIPVEALMADLYSDIDLTGMATGREEMDWGTSERLGSQDWQTGEREGAQTWQTGERIGAQDWQAGENVLDRTFTTSERKAVEEFTSDERVASQTWARQENIDQRGWESAEAVLGRTFTTSERVAIEAFNSGQAELDRSLVTSERVAGQTWQGGESALDRALVSSERVAGQTWEAGQSVLERTFAAAQAELGREFTTDEREAIQAFNRQERLGSEGFAAGESATARNWQSIWNQADLGVQREQLALQTAAQEEAIRQFGVGQTFQERQFNELSAAQQGEEAWRQQQFGELSAAQEAQQSLDRAMYNIQRQQLNEQKSQFDIGQAWQEREFNELSAAEQQNLAMQQLTAGIDPATGQYRGYDPADPYAAFSPQEQYAAMAENQLPLTALLPQLAETPEDQQKIAEFMGQFATATAMGQEVTDEAVITALASSADLMHLIPELMGLQMQDWRTQVPGGAGGVSPWETPTTWPTAELADEGSWWDPRGDAAALANPAMNYSRDPSDWVTAGDFLGQNRSWGNEGAPLDRIMDPLVSVGGGLLNLRDPSAWTRRARGLGGWFIGE